MNQSAKNLSIKDPETLYKFYCWAIWNLEPSQWVTLYEPSKQDWTNYTDAINDEGVENCKGFYEWASEQTDRYLPREEHLAKFVMISN